MASPHIAGLAAYMLGTEWAKDAAIMDAQALLDSTPGYKQLFFGTRNAPVPKEPVVSPKTLKKAMIKVGTKGILSVSFLLPTLLFVRFLGSDATQSTRTSELDPPTSSRSTTTLPRLTRLLPRTTSWNRLSSSHTSRNSRRNSRLFDPRSVTKSTR